MKRGTQARRGFLLAFLGMAFLSCNYINAKIALGGFNPATFTAIWMSSAAGYAVFLLAARRQLGAVRLTGLPFKGMMGLGLCNTMAQLLMWQGLDRLDPSFSAFLGRFSPMISILVGVVLLRERIRALEWGAVAVMIAGGALSAAGSVWRLEWAGIFLTLGSGFFIALQYPIAKRFGGEVPSLVMNFYRVSVAAGVATLWVFGTGQWEVGRATPRHWMALGVGAFLGPFLSYVLTFASYRYWDMSRSAIVMTLQPLVVIPLAYLFFGSVPTGLKLVGGLVILAGGLGLALVNRSADEEEVDAVAPAGREVVGGKG